MSKKSMEGWDFELVIDGQPIRQKFTAGDSITGIDWGYSSASGLTVSSKVDGAWSNQRTLLIGQCEWCGKHATGDPKSTPFLCEDCTTHPDRPPLILCSQCGERLTEVIGVSRKYFRCEPCKRELGR